MKQNKTNEEVVKRLNLAKPFIMAIIEQNEQDGGLVDIERDGGGLVELSADKIAQKSSPTYVYEASWNGKTSYAEGKNLKQLQASIKECFDKLANEYQMTIDTGN